MKLIPLFLLVGMFAIAGWAEDAKPEAYSPELVKDAEAQYKLGRSYYNGKGVTKDYKEAVKWIT
jgi:TPR repeat protein